MKIQQIITSLLLSSDERVIFREPSLVKPPIIVFAGTKNAEDVFKYDANLLPTFWPLENKNTTNGGYVHRGFSKRTLDCIKEIKDFVDMYDNFILGGHSLGGACAVLSASKLKNDDKKIKSIYTFGMPKLAHNSFRRYYSEQGLSEITYNYATTNDIVVNLPYDKIYKSVGNNILLNFDDKNVIKSHDLEIYDKLIKFI